MVNIPLRTGTHLLSHNLLARSSWDMWHLHFCTLIWNMKVFFPAPSLFPLSLVVTVAEILWKALGNPSLCWAPTWAPHGQFKSWTTCITSRQASWPSAVFIARTTEQPEPHEDAGLNWGPWEFIKMVVAMRALKNTSVVKGQSYI